MGARGKQTVFESPYAITYLLILVNVAAFAFTLPGGSLMRIEPATLLRDGALYRDALAHKEYWRLIAYAFLHANVLHFGLNMMCIAAWSGLLEHRLGATYFLAVYLASAAGGGLASVYGHAGPFIGVGASGAIFGVLGGLLCLTLLGKIALAPQFFIVTIGVNSLLAARLPNIDWMAHLGGFTAGFAACALLDVIEKLNRMWLRCRFPEFVKFALAMLATFFLWRLYGEAAPSDGRLPLLAAEVGLSFLVAIKLSDAVLSQPKGLAALALVAAGIYAALTFAVLNTFVGSFPAFCQTLYPYASAGLLQRAAPSIGFACRNTALWPEFLTIAVFLASMLILWPEWRRGLGDVGFVANSFRGERNRRRRL